MIKEKSFWNDELEAPLLNRNANFINKDNVDELISRAQQWLDLANKKGEVESLVWKQATEDEETQRIFVVDAERTFKNPEHRENLVEVLATLHQEINDYHQGLGFIVAFLLLFLDKQDVVKLILSLHRNYVPGYFKAAPVMYVRDAKTYEKILKEKNLAVYEHVTKLVPAEAYCSKWFVGFNIHVLTFAAVVEFLEAFLSYGGDFHFCFALALVSNIEQDLLSTSNVAKIMASLRLDATVYPDCKADDNGIPGSFFTKIVKDAQSIDLSTINIEKLREETLTEMAEDDRKRQLRNAMLKLDEDDDEIVFSDEE